MMLVSIQLTYFIVLTQNFKFLQKWIISCDLKFFFLNIKKNKTALV